MRLLAPQHGPICLDVREIIHVDAGHGVGLEVLHDAGFGYMAHLIVVVAELQRDEGVKASRTILKLTQLLHMVDAVAVILDMSVKHCRVAVHAERMCRGVDIQPTCAIYLVGRDLLPDLRGEDLGPAAGQRVQSRFMQVFHAFGPGHFRFAEHIVQFHRSETLEMKVRPLRPDAAEQFGEEMDVHLRMHATDDMHLGDRLAVVFLHFVDHLVDAQFPAFLPLRVEPGI